MSDKEPFAIPRDRLEQLQQETEEAMQRARSMGLDPTTREWLVDVPPYNDDGVLIERFEITEREAMVEKLRAAFNPQRDDRSTDPGIYTRLTVDGVLWMTDTPAEVRDHREVDAAFADIPGGSALIVGLGLGMVLNRALERRLSFVEVVEREPRIIKAVGQHYHDKAQRLGVKLWIHQADIHDWRPPKHSYWDVGWFDIWPTINDDDMPEVTRLRSRFRTRLGWFAAWGQNERIAMRRRVRSGKWAY